MTTEVKIINKAAEGGKSLSVGTGSDEATVVAPGTSATFWLHDTNDLHVTEIQPAAESDEDSVQKGDEPGADDGDGGGPAGNGGAPDPGADSGDSSGSQDQGNTGGEGDGGDGNSDSA